MNKKIISAGLMVSAIFAQCAYAHTNRELDNAYNAFISNLKTCSPYTSTVSSSLYFGNTKLMNAFDTKRIMGMNFGYCEVHEEITPVDGDDFEYICRYPEAELKNMTREKWEKNLGNRSICQFDD